MAKLNELSTVVEVREYTVFREYRNVEELTEAWGVEPENLNPEALRALPSFWEGVNKRFVKLAVLDKETGERRNYFVPAIEDIEISHSMNPEIDWCLVGIPHHTKKVYAWLGVDVVPTHGFCIVFRDESGDLVAVERPYRPWRYEVIEKTKELGAGACVKKH